MGPDGPILSAEQFVTTLVVKLAVMALIATVLVRYWRFRHILIFERRGWPDRLIFVISMGLTTAAGVSLRLLLGYDAADLTLEAPFVVGLIAGPYAGALVGLAAAGPALIATEWVALPFAVGCGFAGGGLRAAAPKEAIWHFSPFVFTQLPKRVWRFFRNPALDWQVTLVLAPLGLELLRQMLGVRYPRLMFSLHPDTPSVGLWLLGLLATVLCVATPIKIWNSARIEHRLEEQEKLLLSAKIEALASQINPHFLFNTLTSISSLIRSNPDTARMVINKLAGLLRRLLRSHDHFVTLREEIESIDEYLDIEVVRFGPSLKVEKQIARDTLGVLVPSMILQPLVENSIKHGISRKVGGGRIVIKSWRDGDRAIIEVRDDGLGMSKERLSSAVGDGIGMSNVNERLRVIYGEGHGLKVTSETGQGTSARIEIPDTALVERITA